MASAEQNSIKYENTERVLNEFAQEVVEAYKKGVIQYDAIASHRLLDKVDVGPISTDGGKFIVTIKLMDYWKYVEAGRQAGKMPPVSAIEEWLSYKRDINGSTQRGVPSYAALTPSLMDTSVPKSTNSLAWAIATNIKKYGIKARPILAPSVEETFKNFRESIAEAVAKDVGNSFIAIIASLWSNVKLEKVDGEWQDTTVTDIMVL